MLEYWQLTATLAPQFPHLYICIYIPYHVDLVANDFHDNLPYNCVCVLLLLLFYLFLVMTYISVIQGLRVFHRVIQKVS